MRRLIVSIGMTEMLFSGHYALAQTPVPATGSRSIVISTPELGPGGGATLLQHSYGLIVGLWQLMHPNERMGKAMERPEMKVLKRDYDSEVEAALRALWAGSMGNAAASKRKSK